MVRLNRIYTRTGDDGTTGLGDGSRRAKHDARVEAFGAVDEANCAIGLARLETRDSADAGLAAIEATLARAQNDLFDLGADLCAPPTPTKSTRGCASRRARSNGSNARSTRSMPTSRRCARSCCRAERGRRRRCTRRASSAGAPSGA